MEEMRCNCRSESENVEKSAAPGRFGVTAFLVRVDHRITFRGVRQLELRGSSSCAFEARLTSSGCFHFAYS